MVGRTTSAPEIVVLPDVTPVQQLPESQTPTHLASNLPANRKKTKKSKRDKHPALEPSRAVEVPVAQAVGPEIIEILDTDDEEDLRATTRALIPPASFIPVSSSAAPIVASSSKKKKKKTVSNSKEKTSSSSHIPSMNATAIASSSSREKTPIPQTSSPNSTTAQTSPPSQKKKVSSSKEKTEKAEKAARKQARAERRARKAERRAKLAEKDGDKDSAAAVATAGVVAALSLGGVTGSTSREGKKKDKQKKTLRAAWTAGGRRDAPIDIDEEERYRSLSRLQVVDEDAQKEQEAQMRYEIMLQKLQNTAVPLKAPSEGIREEAWQAELRCSGNLTNAGLAAKGVWKGHSVSISS